MYAQMHIISQHRGEKIQNSLNIMLENENATKCKFNSVPKKQAYNFDTYTQCIDIGMSDIRVFFRVFTTNLNINGEKAH
jgi:enhancing lycopene biosynthesis protein 2